MENDSNNTSDDFLSPEHQFQSYLVEYDKTQDSAQHHDSLVWNITSLNWVGSALLMGFVLNGLPTSKCLSNKLALFVISLVGIVLSILVWRWEYQLRGVKVLKYKRCQEIEKILGMKQHTCLPYKAGSQTLTYSILMCLFLFAWIVLVVLVIIA